jgi:hypothetical protein
MVTSREPNRSWPNEMNKIWPKPKLVDEKRMMGDYYFSLSIFVCPSQRSKGQ